MHSLREHLIDEDLGERGRDDPGHHQKCAGNDSEGERVAKADEPRAERGDHARGAPALAERRPRAQRDRDAGVGLVELVRGQIVPAVVIDSEGVDLVAEISGAGW